MLRFSPGEFVREACLLVPVSRALLNGLLRVVSGRYTADGIQKKWCVFLQVATFQLRQETLPMETRKSVVQVLEKDALNDL